MFSEFVQIQIEIKLELNYKICLLNLHNMENSFSSNISWEILSSALKASNQAPAISTIWVIVKDFKIASDFIVCLIYIYIDKLKCV